MFLTQEWHPYFETGCHAVPISQAKLEIGKLTSIHFKLESRLYGREY